MNTKPDIHTVYHVHLPLTVLVLVLVWALCVWRFDLYPPVGTYIAVLAFLAALVTVWPAEHPRGRAAWIFVFLFVMAFEVKNLYRDRALHDAAQSEDRKEAQQNFQRIADGITTAIQQSQNHFDTTMKAEAGIAHLAENNLKTLNGEGSVPCVVPQSHAVVNGVVPLVVWNKGKNDLTGVEVRILSDTEFLDQTSLFYKRSADLGTLHPTWPKPLPEGISPAVDKDGVAHYLIEIWTQNGYYTEVINFRRSKYSLPWAYQYWLSKHVSPKKGTMIGSIQKSCVSDKWSDDLGDGKPIK